MKRMYGYIRVSTVQQGTHGVSLGEQRAAISQYAQRHGIEIIEWFEEQETAAKQGRPIFSHMLKLIVGGKSDGVVIHKIDRSARNLRDWADLGHLIDIGIDVHFAHESLDLKARGGRLAADIQAVVAADFIRNLREEAKKGMYGRLKQGVFPFGAPIGYLNTGAGNPKAIDPKYGPMVRHCFERYATGLYSLHTLQTELTDLGYRTPSGGPIAIHTLSKILNNPFYYGLMVLRSTGEVFEGAHVPIISKRLFDQVATALLGKYPKRSQKHDFMFRRLVQCGHCNYSLIGETQKGHRYYRCHTKGCPTTAIREEQLDDALSRHFHAIKLPEPLVSILRERVDAYSHTDLTSGEKRTKTLEHELTQVQDRFDRLTDGFLDGSIDKDTFEHRKVSLLRNKKALEDDLTAMSVGTEMREVRAKKRLELLTSVYSQYISGEPDEKRESIEITTSNRMVHGKQFDFQPLKPFDAVAEAAAVYRCAPRGYRPRTEPSVGRIVQWLFDSS